MTDSEKKQKQKLRKEFRKEFEDVTGKSFYSIDYARWLETKLVGLIESPSKKPKSSHIL